MPADDQASGPRVSRCEDDDAAVRTKRLTLCKSNRSRSSTEDAELDAPMSPRVRKRLDEAKENATVFAPVCGQGEVVQWMSACHSALIPFGCDLERRGFLTLSSIAFLTEEDIDPSIGPAIRQLLLTTLARLRHEFFRM